MCSTWAVKPGGPYRRRCVVAAQADAQQPVEAEEVVHVRVGDEHVRDAQQLLVGQGREIAEIEQQRPWLELEVDVEPGIAKRLVHEFGGKYGAHGGELMISCAVLSRLDGVTMKIQVECYAGYRGEQEPRAFTLGDRRLEVTAIQDRWLAPHHPASDGDTYILRHDESSGEWTLGAFRKGVE